MTEKFCINGLLFPCFGDIVCPGDALILDDEVDDEVKKEAE